VRIAREDDDAGLVAQSEVGTLRVRADEETYVAENAAVGLEGRKPAPEEIGLVLPRPR
jgi:hypothetical protein